MRKLLSFIMVLGVLFLSCFPALSIIPNKKKLTLPEIRFDWLHKKPPSQPVSQKQESHRVKVYYEFAEKKNFILPDSVKEILHNLAHEDWGDLVFAVIFAESTFRPKAKNANNYGLMQISDVHFTKYAKARRFIKWCGVKDKEDLFNPHKNVCVGRALLLEHLEENNYSVKKALMAYNASSKKEVYAEKVKKTYKEIRRMRKRL